MSEIESPRVIGVDLSMTSTGIAVVDSHCGDVYTVKSKGHRGDSWLQRGNRLGRMVNDIVFIVEQNDPDLVVVEAPSYGSNMPGRHDVSGLWWLTVNRLLRWPVAFVAPKARAKYGTGHGNSPKDVVKAFVMEVYTDHLCGPSARFRNDDECDAMLLAAMGMRHLGWPIEEHDLHEDNLAAMEKVAWPEM